MRKPFINNCTIERLRLVRSCTWNVVTGAETNVNEEYKIEPCNAPLFDDGEHTSGVCSTCASGWSQPNNEITQDGWAMLKAAGYNVLVAK